MATITPSKETQVWESRIEAIRELRSRLPRTRPPLSWTTLTRLSDTFIWSPDEKTLSNILEGWETYWNSVWDNCPPALRFLIEVWEGIIEEIDFKPDTEQERIIQSQEFQDLIRSVAISNDLENGFIHVPFPLIRFRNKSKASRYAFEIGEGFFANQFIRIVNTEISHYELETILSKSKGISREMVRMGLSMVLINRIFLALERFAFKTNLEEEWIGNDRNPPLYEVLVDRVQRTLNIHRSLSDPALDVSLNDPANFEER